MAVRITLKRADYKITIDKALGPDARSRAFGAFARQKLAEAEAKNAAAIGSVPPHTTAIDGVQSDDSALDTAQRIVVFEFKLLGELVQWISDELEKASPRRSGRYARSHIVFADGAQIEPGQQTPQAREYVFLNVMPYARKIEPGSGWAQSHGHTLSRQAPDGVYELVAARARARFSNLAKIQFSYETPSGGAVVEWAANTTGAHFKSRSAKRRLGKTRSGDWLARQPAIVVIVGGT